MNFELRAPPITFSIVYFSARHSSILVCARVVIPRVGYHLASYHAVSVRFCASRFVAPRTTVGNQD